MWERREGFIMNSIAVDSAKYIERGMWGKIDCSFICLSFHHKKALPIGRGGMISSFTIESSRL